MNALRNYLSYISNRVPNNYLHFCKVIAP
eukprot:SAG31_NODE_45014_length_260_cov_0.962733_1_plen_28_part_01